MAHLEKHARSPMAMSVISLMGLYFGAHRSRRTESNNERHFGRIEGLKLVNWGVG